MPMTRVCARYVGYSTLLVPFAQFVIGQRRQGQLCCCTRQKTPQAQGRRPACSRPACGFRSIHTASSRRGIMQPTSPRFVANARAGVDLPMPIGLGNLPQQIVQPQRTTHGRADSQHGTIATEANRAIDVQR